MTTPGPAEKDQRPERPRRGPQPGPQRGVPSGVPGRVHPPAVLTDSRPRWSARFSATVGAVLYGLGAGSAALSVLGSWPRTPGLQDLLTVVFLLSAAAALGFGVHRSRQAGDALPVLVAGLLATALLGVYWTLGGIPRSYQGMSALHAVFIAPVLCAVALAALARLTERFQGPPTSRVTSVRAHPYPWVSTVFALVLYAVVCLFAAMTYFLLAGGLNVDPVPAEPAPATVLLSALGLCLPLPLLVIGLSASLSGRVRTAAPIFVTAALAALAVLLSAPLVLVEFTDAWPLRWALTLLLVLPLFWPLLRSWKSVPEAHRRSWFGL